MIRVAPTMIFDGNPSVRPALTCTDELPPTGASLKTFFRTEELFMSLTHSQLLEVAKSHIPSAIALWPDRVGAERQWHRLAVEPDHDVWAIAWPSYSSTGLHDHDGSQGVICPVWGYLIENRWDGAKREMRLGKAGVEPIHESTVHDVISLGSSLTVHAYSPPLKKMRYYEHEVALDSRGKRRQAVLFLREEMV